MRMTLMTSIGEGQMEKIDQILVPVDGSEGAGRALDMAILLADRCGVPLKLAYVVPLTAESAMALSHLDKEEVEETSQKVAGDVLTKAREAIAGGFEGLADDVVLIGDAATEIINYLNKHPDTLVVMGRRGLSPLKNLVLGSVSDKVMRYGGNAVMVVG